MANTKELAVRELSVIEKTILAIANSYKKSGKPTKPFFAEIKNYEPDDVITRVKTPKPGRLYIYVSGKIFLLAHGSHLEGVFELEELKKRAAQVILAEDNQQDETGEVELELLTGLNMLSRDLDKLRLLVMTNNLRNASESDSTGRNGLGG